MLKVLYFASLRETLGCASESIDLPPAVNNVAGLLDLLAARGEHWLKLATVKNLRCAVNQELASLDAPIKGGDEVAFFPPVTGG
jgi:molybdopterin synthase sulfur carrier subunit